tara:strand:- start:1479 stop:1997 length:519 start_codon:yes stop_codon:yes gene_type:complete
MKKYLSLSFLLFIFNVSYSHAEIKVAYIDVNFILNNSIVGKSITEHISKIEKNKSNEFSSIQKKLTDKEKNIISKKNIISSDEFNNQIEILKDEIKKYRIDKEKFINKINSDKKKYTKIVLDSLNPIISSYVEENSITIVFPKKNIVVAKKKLEITMQIMDLLNKKLNKIDF